MTLSGFPMLDSSLARVAAKKSVASILNGRARSIPYVGRDALFQLVVKFHPVWSAPQGFMGSRQGILPGFSIPAFLGIFCSP